MRLALVLCALWVGGLLAGAPPWVRAADEELPAGTEAVAKQRGFTADDLYGYDEDGMEMPLQILPKLLVVHVRGGRKPEGIRALIEEVPEVGAVEFRREQGLFLVRLKEAVIDLHYEIERRLAVLLQIVNRLNAELGEGGYATPVARVQGKTLALSDTFFVQFKSFVTADEVESFNAANDVEHLPGREAPAGALCLRVKPSAGRNILRMLHLYHEEPRVRTARLMFVPLFPPVTVRAELDVSATMLGDEVIYRLVVGKDPNVNVDWAMLAKDTITLLAEGLSSEGLVITEAQDLGPRERDGHVEEIREYVLVFYEVGDFVLPEVTVYYTVGDNPQPLEVRGNTVHVHVASLVGRGMEDINDLPLQVATGSQTLSPRKGSGFLLAGVCLVVASAVGTMWRVAAGRRRRAAEVLSAEATAREEALRGLEVLSERIRVASHATDPQVAEAMRLEASAVVRQALEAVYHVPTRGGSTLRVLHELERLPVEEEVMGLVEEVLASYCDKRFLPPERRTLPTAAELDSIAGVVARLAGHLRTAARGMAGLASAVA